MWKNWWQNPYKPGVGDIFLEPTLESEILTSVSNFRNKYSTGYDNVSMNLVKSTISAITTPLKNVCNMSFQTGIFPDQMKLAKVIPVYKTGDKKQLSDYRPISILPQFKKKIGEVIL